MRLTPLDIRKQEFKKAMRGLDADEVYAFLSTIADEYEAVLNDNKALRERLLELDDKVQEYRNMEKTLRDTLLTAERVTVEAKDNARREAELIIRQAELEADRGVRQIKSNALKLRQDIQTLKQQRESYIARMRMLVETHLKFLESADKDFTEEEREIDREQRELLQRIDESEESPSRSALDRRQSARPPATPGDAPMPPPLDRPLKRSTDSADGPTTSASSDPRDETRFKPQSDAAGERPRLDLNGLLDRIIKGQKEALAEEGISGADDIAQLADGEVETDAPRTATGTAADAGGSTATGTATRAAPESEDNGRWSLEKLRRTILSRGSADDETP